MWRDAIVFDSSRRFSVFAFKVEDWKLCFLHWQQYARIERFIVICGQKQHFQKIALQGIFNFQFFEEG